MQHIEPVTAAQSGHVSDCFRFETAITLAAKDWIASVPITMDSNTVTQGPQTVFQWVVVAT
jgi:hypothetical protein